MTPPTAAWSMGITTDAAGSVYAAGNEGSGKRLFVAKCSADGAAMWTQVISGAAGTIPFSDQRVAVDTAGNVLVVGRYRGKIDFNPDPTKTNFLRSIGNSYDAFVLKLNATGAYVWSGSKPFHLARPRIASALRGRYACLHVRRHPHPLGHRARRSFRRGAAPAARL